MPTDIDREHGLSYIVDKLEREGLVTMDDVIIFMKDLSLPPMSVEDLQQKFIAVGANTFTFNKFPHFFQFVLNELEKDSEKDRSDAFKVFDEDETGFLEASELRETLSDLGNKMIPSDIDTALRMSDMDGDGTILYDEVIKITKQNEEAFEYRAVVNEERPKTGFSGILMTHAPVSYAHDSPVSTPSS